jgi:hypothetical protein
MTMVKFITVFEIFRSQNIRYRGYNQVHRGLEKWDSSLYPIPWLQLRPPRCVRKRD